MKSKPAVAFANQAVARANIEAKIGKLRELLESRVGDFSPPDVAKSLNSFNAWAVESDGATPGFTRTNNETLRKHPDLKSSVDELLRIAQGSVRPKARPRDLGLQRARDNVALHKTIRGIAERSVVALEEENAQLRKEIEVLRSQQRSTAEEALRELERLRSELAEVRAMYVQAQKAAGGKVVRLSK